MRNKNVTAVLAFFLGIFGVHRFYLGQFERGALQIVYPIVILLIIFWVTGSIEIAREQVSLEFTGKIIWPLLPFLLIPLFDTIWFATRSTDKFNARYNKNKIRWSGEILTSVGYILLASLLVYWLFNKFLVAKHADVGGIADYAVTAEAMATEFDADEDAATVKYEEKVVLVSGTVSLLSSSSGTGDPNLILAGTEHSSINCEFAGDQVQLVRPIVVGQSVSVKGRFGDHMLGEVQLKDCILVEPGAVMEPKEGI